MVDSSKNLDSKEIKRMMDLFRKEEALDPELSRYIGTLPDIGWKVLKHPLVFMVPYFDVENARINAMFKHKKEAVEKARVEEDYSSFVFLHERPHRLEAFDEIQSELDDHVYWSLLSSIWIDTENAYQNHDLWKEFWDSNRPRREDAMDEDDKKEYDSLPEMITIYRGFTHDEAINGLSWTTNHEKAKWFALRFSSEERDDKNPPKVASTVINKDQVIAYFGGRGESEVLINPETFINTVKIERITKGRK